MGILGSISHGITRIGRRIMGDNRLMVRGYFEHIYRNEDPYRTRVDPEGDQKRADIVRALDGQRFRRGLELGSGEGTLALLYHAQVDDLTLTDISTRALARAQERLEEQAREQARSRAGAPSTEPAAADHTEPGRVTTRRLDFVADSLPGTFDLIVCQESLVYTRVADLPAVSDKIITALEPGGTLVLLHPRSIHDDDSGLEYKDIGAKTVHQPFIDDPRVSVDLDETYPNYRITRLHREAGGDRGAASNR